MVVRKYRRSKVKPADCNTRLLDNIGRSGVWGPDLGTSFRGGGGYGR